MATKTPAPPIRLIAGSVFLLLLLLLPAGGFPAAAQQPPAVKWLVIPVKDLAGEGPVGIEAAVTAALVTKLSTVPGWSAAANDPQSQLVRDAVREGAITEEEAALVPDLASARRLGLIAGADTVLIGLLVRQEQSILLVLNVVGTIGRQTAGPAKQIELAPSSVPVTPDRAAPALAEALTQGIAEKLTALVQANRGLWARDPAFASDWEVEGDRDLAEGRYREARMAFTAALAADPSRSTSRRKLAESLLGLGQPDKARQQLEQALAAAPQDVELLLALGEVQLALGNPGRAAGYFESASYLAPSDLRPKRGLARADVARGNLGPALASYAELVGAAPEDAALRYDYGQALMEANRFDKAAEQFRYCLRLNPGDLSARQALATLLLKQGKVADGVQQLRRLAESSPTPMTYSVPEYRRLMRSLNDEFNEVSAAFDQQLGQYWGGTISQDEFAAAVTSLHARSDNLARLLEHTTAPAELDKSHRYWVLAANLLNHSDFEALRYAQNEGADFLRRAQLFRQAAHEAAIEAQNFANTPAAPSPAPDQ